MIDLCSSLEAILFAAGEPVPAARISLVLNEEESNILSAAGELNRTYLNHNHSLRILQMGEKLQLCTAPEYNAMIVKILEQRKPPSLSQSALETLAIVAYYQPATAAYISKVRGVDSAYTISSLNEKGLIESKGRLDAPGRPVLYGTTDLFLRTMGIVQLSDLPKLPELTASEGVAELQKAIDAICLEKDVQMTIDELESVPDAQPNGETAEK